jgi:hypothetical protein
LATSGLGIHLAMMHFFEEGKVAPSELSTEDFRPGRMFKRDVQHLQAITGPADKARYTMTAFVNGTVEKVRNCSENCWSRLQVEALTRIAPAAKRPLHRTCVTCQRRPFFWAFANHELAGSSTTCLFTQKQTSVVFPTSRRILQQTPLTGSDRLCHKAP